jgi:predicted TPR repeat methyltransferase
MIPPNVGERDAELLRRAYDLADMDESAQLYAEWAETYDQTMVDGLGYVSPKHLGDLLAKVVEWRDRPIADLGCGTGLVAVGLADQGFTTFDGIDLSLAMTGVAARRGIYRQFIAADLTAVLPIADNSYGAAICNGTFTSGHVGAESLAEIVRIIEPGGVLCCAVHHAVWDDMGFAPTFIEMLAAGTIEEISVERAAFYATSTDDGRHCAYRKR